MGISENYPIPRNLIPQSPVLVFRNREAEPHPFKSFCTWCCCITCGFIFFLFLVSLGAKKDLEKDKLSLAYEGREYESRHFPRPLGTRNSSRRTTVIPEVNYTVKPTLSKNETVPEATKKNTCSTSTCENLGGLMHACGNTEGFQNYLNKIQIDNFNEKLKESFNQVSNFLENNSKELLMPSEKNLKKIFQKCLKRTDRDVEDLMKTLTEEFKWPFHEKEKYKKNIYVVNDILSKLIKLNPKALQLFEVVGKDKQLKIRPSFCHGKHDPIDTNALQVIFNIISENPDVRKLLENSLHIALEVDKAREYCTEISPPTHHKNEFDVDFDRSHIDFIQIFQLENNSPEEVLSHLNFTDSYEIFQKDSFLNKLLDFHSIGIAHYLVIKYLEDISTKLLLPDKEHCAMITFHIMPDAFFSIYENHILRPENSELIPDFINSLKSEYLELASESSKLEGQKENILRRIQEFKGEIGMVGRTVDISDNDTFYTAFTRLNSHSFEEFSQNLFFKNRNSSSQKLSFNGKIFPSVMFFQMLAAPLNDSEYPLAVQYGRAGHDLAVSMAIELENGFNLHAKCMDSESTEYLAMKAAWNGFQSATKSRSHVKLPGLETLPDEQIFFYSMVQSKCQEEGRIQVNDVLKKMKEFRETFGCPLMEKSENCEPFL